MPTITEKQKAIIQDTLEAVNFELEESKYINLTWQEASKVITVLKRLEKAYYSNSEHTKKQLRALSVPLIKELGLPLPSIESFYKLSHAQMTQVVHKLFIKKALRDVHAVIR